MSSTLWTSEAIGDQKDRVVIVTGANSGIGLEAVRELARRGAHVVLACRSEQRATAAIASLKAEHLSGSLAYIHLDLARLDSVHQFAQRFRTEHGRLDVLINNAGVMMPPAGKTADGFELQFGINHLGHFALTGLLIDLLQGTPASRVVNVASLAHRWGTIDFEDLQWERRRYRKWPSYGASKLANLLFTFELQRRLEARGSEVIALAAHPGWTHTELQRHISGAGLFGTLLAMKPWQGALPTLRAAAAVDVKGGDYYGPGGFQQLRGYPVTVEASEAAHDQAVARRLWEVSAELTGVPFLLREAAAA